MIARTLLVVLCIAFATTTARAQTPPSTADLAFLLGDWRGEARLYQPFAPDRAAIDEASDAHCAYVLRNAHIQCTSTWTRVDGRSRTFFMFANYNEAASAHELLFIYHNYGAETSYPIAWDEALQAYVGFTDTTTPDNRPARERVEWRVSADGREIVCHEFIQVVGEDTWAKTFEFTWRRV